MCVRERERAFARLPEMEQKPTAISFLGLHWKVRQTCEGNPSLPLPHLPPSPFISSHYLLREISRDTERRRERDSERPTESSLNIACQRWNKSLLQYPFWVYSDIQRKEAQGAVSEREKKGNRTAKKTRDGAKKRRGKRGRPAERGGGGR